MNFLQEYLLETTGTCCPACLVKKLLRYKRYIILDLVIVYIIFRSVKNYKIGLLIMVLYIKNKFIPNSFYF